MTDVEVRHVRMTHPARIRMELRRAGALNRAWMALATAAWIAAKRQDRQNARHYARAARDLIAAFGRQSLKS